MYRIFYFGGEAVMRFWEKFFRRIAEMCPFIIVFSIICGLFGMYWAIVTVGDDMAADYYIPILVSVVPAVFFAWLTNETFRSDAEQRRRRFVPGNFDKTMIYQIFDGKNTKKLKGAVAEMHMCNFNEALEMLKEIEKAENEDDRLSVVCFYIGRCYQLMGYPSNAARYFKNALEKGLRLNDVYLLTARCLGQNGFFDEAMEYYGVLVERDAYYDTIYTDIGVVFLKKGDGEKALEYFSRSADEGRNYAFALGGCSLAYLQMKDLEKSNEFYRKALLANMDDVKGFKIFYCNIAEAMGLMDSISPEIRLEADSSGALSEIVR